jgi:hypothetical protein
MKSIMFGIAMALALGGCSKHGVDGKIDEFGGFRDRMCECTDATCGNQVLGDWRSWRAGTRDIKPDADQKVRIAKIDSEFHACEHKVGAGTP